MNPSSIHQVTRREQGAEQKRADREKGFPKDDDVAGEAEGVGGNRDTVKGPCYVTVPQGYSLNGPQSGTKVAHGTVTHAKW